MSQDLQGILGFVAGLIVMAALSFFFTTKKGSAPTTSHPWYKGHDWTPWQTTKEGELARIGTNSIVGFGLIQERTCKICKITELRMERT